MNKDSKPTNVIQFPTAQVQASTVSKGDDSVSSSRGEDGRLKAALPKLGALAAILLATAAVNRFAFAPNFETTLASTGGPGTTTRTIASAGARSGPSWLRDAAWEKQLAESLAQSRGRSIASLSHGLNASPEARLRGGPLMEKYTIAKLDPYKTISSITLQDSETDPVYLLNRAAFLQEFGSLLQPSFGSVRLNSVEETGGDRMVEAYEILNQSKVPVAVVRIELDRHQRFYSLVVKPI